MISRRKPIKLTPAQAAMIATTELGRRVPAATIRSWRHRDLLRGGPGWIDGEHLGAFLAQWKAKPYP